MYILTQSDLDTFNSLKSNYPDIGESVDVEPVANGTYNGLQFTPDGTYNLDESFFAPEAQGFLNYLKSQNFFTNLKQQ